MRLSQRNHRFREMVRDTCVGADPLLERRLDRRVDATTGAFLKTLDDSERTAANLSLQRAALVADDTWEHTVRGHHAWSAVGPLITHVERADPSTEEDESEEISFVSARRARCVVVLLCCFGCFGCWLLVVVCCVLCVVVVVCCVLFRCFTLTLTRVT